jgi:hypothetical protein
MGIHLQEKMGIHLQEKMGIHLQEKMGTSSVHPAAVRSFALNVAAAAAQCYPKS